MLDILTKFQGKIRSSSWLFYDSYLQFYGRLKITLQCLQILYTFVLQFSHAIQKYTKFANFARLYFPYFTTFRNQTLQ
jgi:hypothetical protein